jgi:hypothetical protein
VRAASSPPVAALRRGTGSPAPEFGHSRLEPILATARAESAPAYQPRVTPWENRPYPPRAPCKGAGHPARMSRSLVKSLIDEGHLWEGSNCPRPCRAGWDYATVFPGRCPGLVRPHAVGVQNVHTPARGWEPREPAAWKAALREQSRRAEPFLGLAINEPDVIASSCGRLEMNNLGASAAQPMRFGSTNPPSHDGR